MPRRHLLLVCGLLGGRAGHLSVTSLGDTLCVIDCLRAGFVMAVHLVYPCASCVVCGCDCATLMGVEQGMSLALREQRPWRPSWAS